jgi:hypothetical protein
LKGEEKNQEMMGEIKDKDKRKGSDQTDIAKTCQRTIAEEIVANHKEGKLVYCRFGKKYVANLEKQLNSIIPGN